MISKLIIDENYEMKLYLYPIFTDNLITNFQSRFVNKEEFDEVHQSLVNRSAMFNELVQTDKDQFGYYFEIPVQNT